MVAILSRTDLARGLERARSGGRAPGVDGQELRQALAEPDHVVDHLHEALTSGAWQPAALRRVTVAKPNGGERVLGIPTVADRVVGQAVLLRLSALLADRVHPAAHAYMPGRGAHSALELAERWRRDGDSQALAADIRDFFPSIDRERLFALLLAWLPGEGCLLGLARALVSMPYEGETAPPPRGLPQGVAFSPLLSNCFLHAIDAAQHHLGHYLRYCDNLLLLDRDQQVLQDRGEHLRLDLATLGLHLKPTGTVLAPLSEGVPFLGFTLTDEGPCPGPASDVHLREALAGDDATAAARGVVSDPVQVSERLRRWGSYFRRPPAPRVATPEADDTARSQAAAELLAEVRLVAERSGPEHIARYRSRAAAFDDLRDRGFHRAWAALLLAAGLHVEAEAALARHRSLEPADPCAAYLSARLHLARRCHDRALADLDTCLETAPAFGEAWRLKASIYRHLGVETLATAAERELATLPCDHSAGVADILTLTRRQPRVQGTAEERDAALRALRGHKGLHARACSDVAGRLAYRPVMEGIDHAAFTEHLAGRCTLSAYPVRTDGTLRWAVLDIDITQKTLQRHRHDEEALEDLRRRAWQATAALRDAAEAMGLQAVAEDSGHKGYHLWFLFEDATPAARARDLLLAICRRAGEAPRGIAVEVFPASAQAGVDLPGSRVKLPWGIHRGSGRRSRLLDRLGEPAVHQFQVLLRARRLTRGDVERALEGAATPPPPVRAAADPAAAVLAGCAVLAGLARKAEQFRHLTHHERTIVASVLRPLGESGQAETHRIIGHCLNYDRHVTARFIAKQHDQPMGCRRIGILCPGLATPEACRCRFPARKDTYPSPARHAGLVPRLEVVRAAKEPTRRASATGTLAPQQPAGRAPTSRRQADPVPRGPVRVAAPPSPEPALTEPPASGARMDHTTARHARPPVGDHMPKPSCPPPPSDAIAALLQARQAVSRADAGLRQELERCGGELCTTAGRARLDADGTVWLAL